MKVTESLVVNLTDAEIRGILIAHVKEKLGGALGDWDVTVHYSDGRGPDDYPIYSATVTRNVSKPQ